MKYLVILLGMLFLGKTEAQTPKAGVDSQWTVTYKKGVVTYTKQKRIVTKLPPVITNIKVDPSVTSKFGNDIFDDYQPGKDDTLAGFKSGGGMIVSFSRGISSRQYILYQDASGVIQYRIYEKHISDIFIAIFILLVVVVITTLVCSVIFIVFGTRKKTIVFPILISLFLGRAFFHLMFLNDPLIWGENIPFFIGVIMPTLGGIYFINLFVARPKIAVNGNGGN